MGVQKARVRQMGKVRGFQLPSKKVVIVLVQRRRKRKVVV
jgi:hypothetical protein